MLRVGWASGLAALAALAAATALAHGRHLDLAAQRGLWRAALLLAAAAVAVAAWRRAPEERRARVARTAAMLLAAGALVGGIVREPAPGIRATMAWGPLASWPALEAGVGPLGLRLALGSLALVAAAALVGAVALERARARAAPLAAAPGVVALACAPCAGAVALSLAPLTAWWIPGGASPEQAAIARFFAQATLVAALAVGGVLLWLLVVAVRDRAPGPAVAQGRPSRPARRALLAAFVLVPAGIVYGVGALSLQAQGEVVVDDEGRAREIEVVARQWEWEFHAPGEPPVVGELVLRAGERVRLVLSSEDVIHSFFVPELGVKQDALPGAVTHASFQPTRAGDYPAYCAEYCGSKHTHMRALVRVLPEAAP